MRLSNTFQHYGSVTKSFHWLTALLVLTLIPLGIYANGLPYDTPEALSQKAWFFSLHKTLGVAVFFVALARICWAVSQPKPASLQVENKLEHAAAETVHWLLYGSLLFVPMTGWLHHASTSGFAPIWWPLGQTLPLVPKSESLAALTAGLHIVFERVLAASILLHIAGAIKHHLIDRDATLRRMLPGSPVVPNVSHQKHSYGPLGLAVGIWAIALFIGSAIGVYETHDNRLQAAALEAVQSDWVVENGTLEIAVMQMGSQVTGTFSDWTAAIRFDETVASGNAGSVDVVISIGSLTLGSVTTQALGPDFFNAEGSPTANFTADIERNGETYVAAGMLTIKNQSMPVDLPFSLNVVDGVATMSGATQIDRRDFAVGETQTDENSLGFAVDISAKLVAKKGG